MWNLASPSNFTTSFLPPSLPYLGLEGNGGLLNSVCPYNTGVVEEPCLPIFSSAGSDVWSTIEGRPCLPELNARDGDGLLFDAPSTQSETELQELDLECVPEEELCYGLVCRNSQQIGLSYNLWLD